MKVFVVKTDYACDKIVIAESVRDVMEAYDVPPHTVLDEEHDPHRNVISVERLGEVDKIIERSKV